MKARTASSSKAERSVDFIGDHPAINFINTQRVQDGKLTDTLQSDADVIAWLRKMEVPEPTLEKSAAPGSLLTAARKLRTAALQSVEQRKAGKLPSLDELNHFLAGAQSHLNLHNQRGDLKLERLYQARTAEQYLAPLAETIADLLANGDFDLIRHCEGAGCVLWFYDRTKAHRRRWCTAEGCGMRARVAAFRARQGQSAG